MVFGLECRVCLRYVSGAQAKQQIGKEEIISNGEELSPISSSFYIFGWTTTHLNAIFMEYYRVEFTTASALYGKHICILA